MFDFEPVTEINGWKGHQTALDLSQPRKLLGSAHPRLVSCEPGRERSSIFGLQFRREQSSRRDHLRRRNRMWGRSDIWPDLPVEPKIAAELRPTTIKWRSRDV